MPRPCADTSSQRGAALLIALLILISAALSLLVNRLAAHPAAARDEATLRKLVLARDALIGRSASDVNRPGSLPCPDTDDDGVAQIFSGSQCSTYLGRLPWKTLELGDLRDAAGERLWYALAPALRDNPAAEPINTQSIASLSLDGQGDIAAIVFSPGVPTPAQGARPSNQACDYLDGINCDSSHAYVSSPHTERFNDKVLTISRDDLFNAVSKRILGEIRGPSDATRGLRKYFIDHGSFPWADTDTPSDGSGNATKNTGKLPYNELPWTAAYGCTSLEAQAQPLCKNAWFTLISYDRSDPKAAKITVGHTSLTVAACPRTPCP